MQLINIKTKKYSIHFITGLFLILFSLSTAGSTAAAEISLKEAVEHGLKNNLEIRQQINVVENAERQLKTIRAQQGWQIEVSANYNEIIDQPETNRLSSGVTSPGGSQEASEGANTSLSISRNFGSGFNLSQTAEVDDQGDSDYTVNIAYPLFKGVPTESEKAYYEQEQNLLAEKNSLNSLLEEKLLAWLENFLQLQRLDKSRENAELQLHTAEKTLAESKKLYSDSQISESELKTAESDFIDAENSFSEINNQFKNALKSFKLTLALNEGTEINLEADEYLEEIKAQLIDHQQYGFEKMYQSLTAADYDLESAAVNLELQKKQLQWFQDEGRAEINLNGSYNHSAEVSTIGVNFSYDLFDGGQRKLNEQNLRSRLELAEDNYQNLKENKKIGLENQLNKVLTAERSLESAVLKLDNAENNLELAREQHQAGLITEKAYNKQQLAFKQSQLNYQQAADNLFIEKLNLTMLLNNQYSDKNRGVK
ncbi:TolC family protein [Halanaerobium saccharolyticum]|uniref:TolC family protein n=1 Tax=Halanaerobium saccharolyticum TaxID=43595 RepID=UPI003FCC62F2